eukprot:TRINITY_DN4656_c0_g1_i1.p1 TRINITY_DN4656_c0_g1~~TRINITY_DN4656_c0_g1_i1.p1  ORF type:complete len:274 (-),score=66.32 TRINITY_DN4656_c0_g1_i1:22-843(-)
MTGKPAFRYNFLNEEIRLRIADNSFWNKLIYFSDREFLLGGGTLPENEIPSEYKSIADRHAYAILDAFEFDGNKLLLLKDPRGVTNWVDEWSPDSSRWTSRLKEMLHRRFAKIAARRSNSLISAGALHDLSAQQSHGIFFMSWEELTKCFEAIFVAIFFDEAWSKLVIRDTWREEPCSSFTAVQNTCGRVQYLLNVPEDIEIFFMLTNKVPNSSNSVAKIGFEIHKYRGKPMGELVAVGRYSEERIISLNLSLIHICRCRRIERCRSRWSPYH